MYPYARTIYSQHLTGRTKVLYERAADVFHLLKELETYSRTNIIYLYP